MITNLTNLFLSLIHPGDIVIDTGANIGYYALQAARQVGKDGLVYAFEPDPDNFKALTENIDINSLTNVKAIQKAVSNRTGTTKLYKKDSQSHSMCNHTVIPTRGSILVETIALDDSLYGCPASVRNKISLIKIDVEGAEPLVLEGLGEFLNSKNELTMISELIPNFYAASKPSDYISQLRIFGFEISIIKEDGIIPLQDELLPEIDGTRGVNLLCSKADSPLVASISAAST